MPHLFEPLVLRGLTLKNRIMMSPMCMYSAGQDGVATDWHYVHYTTRAVGGVGLIMLEATAVSSDGRISDADLGLWDDNQVESMARLVSMCHERGAKVGVQLGHAGRKAWSPVKGFGPAPLKGPSPIPQDQDWAIPLELTAAEIDQIVVDFRQAAVRALEAGFDAIELHGAHGYLIHQFLSPISNHRQDQYGGSTENRMRLLHRAVRAVREVWPERLPLLVRVSATDWVPGGLDVAEMVKIARTLPKMGVDLLDCSAGGVVVVPIALGPAYQVPFAHRIKQETGIPTAAVGLISTPELADEIVRNQRADLVILGRELLRCPYWPLEAAAALGTDVQWPVQYLRAKR